MDISSIKVDVGNYLGTVNHENVNWTQVVTDVQAIVKNHASGVKGFNIKIGKDTKRKYNLEIVIPLVFNP